MIKCIIIDDETPSRESLALIASKYFADKLQVVAKAGNIAEGVSFIEKYSPDIVFLDIEMPNENGFDLFTHFQQITFSVVFVTAYREYAIDAIKVSAIDYLLKPINIDDLRNTIDRFEKNQLHKISSEKIDKLVNAFDPLSSNSKRIILPTFFGFQLVKIYTIVFCQADQNYTKVFLSDNTELLISKPLNYIEELLPSEYFFRIHKSFLVNLNYVKAYSRTDGSHIILENDKELPVATRRNEEFIMVLKAVNS